MHIRANRGYFFGRLQYRYLSPFDADAGLIICNNKVLRPIRRFRSGIPVPVILILSAELHCVEMVMCQPWLPKREAADQIQENVWIARTNHDPRKLSSSAEVAAPAGSHPTRGRRQE